MSSIPEKNRLYTYEDYLKWDDSQRWELIDGHAYAMAAPNVWHQRVLLRLSVEFEGHLRGNKCEVFIAPFDVRLDTKRGDYTVVQPDLLVVCDPDKIADGKSCKGAPDLVVEILSPSNPKKDTDIKLRKYREAGVKELWFVHPEPKMIQILTMTNGNYVPRFFHDEINSPTLPKLTLDLKYILDITDVVEENSGPETNLA